MRVEDPIWSNGDKRFFFANYSRRFRGRPKKTMLKCHHSSNVCGANVGQTQFNPPTPRLCSNSPPSVGLVFSPRVFCVRVFHISVAMGNRKNVYTNNNKRRGKNTYLLRPLINDVDNASFFFFFFVSCLLSFEAMSATKGRLISPEKILRGTGDKKAEGAHNVDGITI